MQALWCEAQSGGKMNHKWRNLLAQMSHTQLLNMLVNLECEVAISEDCTYKQQGLMAALWREILHRMGGAER